MTFQYQFFDKNMVPGDDVFGISPAVRVKQIHSNKVVDVTNPLTEWIEADGIITRSTNLPIGIITADCAPVLFYGDGVIGAAHAGWQGALNGVLDNMVVAMGVGPETISAMIGPCISQKSYEVSVGFEQPFIDHHADAERFFMAGARVDKLQFDLAGYCAFRLANCGVGKIHIDGTDTLTNKNYHSHRGGATMTERNLSAVMIKG